jgi:hypothetical protein
MYNRRDGPYPIPILVSASEIDSDNQTEGCVAGARVALARLNRYHTITQGGPAKSCFVS